MSERKFDYNNVGTVYNQMKNINDNIKNLLTDTDNEVHNKVDVCEEAIYGDLGNQLLLSWDNISSNFPNFVDNFENWSALVAKASGDYSQFEADVAAFKNANPLGVTSAGATQGAVATSSYNNSLTAEEIAELDVATVFYEPTGATYIDTGMVEYAKQHKTMNIVGDVLNVVSIALAAVQVGSAVKAASSVVQAGTQTTALAVVGNSADDAALAVVGNSADDAGRLMLTAGANSADDVGLAVVSSTADDAAAAGAKTTAQAAAANLGDDGLNAAGKAAADLGDDGIKAAGQATASNLSDDGLKVLGEKIGKDGRKFIRVKNADGGTDLIEAATGRSTVRDITYSADELKSIGINVGDDVTANVGTQTTKAASAAPNGTTTGPKTTNTGGTTPKGSTGSGAAQTAAGNTGGTATNTANGTKTTWSQKWNNSKAGQWTNTQKDKFYGTKFGQKVQDSANAATNRFNNIKNKVSGWGSSASTGAQNFGTNVKTGASNMYNSAKTGVQNGYNYVKDLNAANPTYAGKWAPGAVGVNIVNIGYDDNQQYDPNVYSNQQNQSGSNNQTP
ncbi:MAG: hypothetical protein ACI4OP_08165 [Candidatus Coprovivens sp.]